MKKIPKAYLTHTLVNVPAVCHIFGQSRRTVDGWIATQGFPVAVQGRGRGNQSLISMEEAFQWNEARTDRFGLKDGKARLAQAQAESAEIALDKARGRISDNDVIEAMWARMVTNCRSKILGLVERLPPLVRATDYTQKAIRAVVRECVHGILQELTLYDGSELIEPRSVGTASRNNGKRVGRRKPSTKRGVQRGAGSVAD